MRHRVLRRQEQALDVDLVDAVELLFRHVEHRLVAVSRAGIVDNDVQAAALGERELHEAGDVGVARHVAGTGQRVSAAPGDLACDRLRTGLVHVVDDDARALFREAARDPGAESGGRAGHDRNPAFKPHARCSSPM